MRISRPIWLLLAVSPAVIFALHNHGFSAAEPHDHFEVANASVVTADAPGTSWQWLAPLGWGLEVLRPFEAPEHRYAAGHRGFDLAAVPGEAVSAPTSGTVTFAGRVVDRDVVSIRVNAATVVSLEPVTSQVAAGDTVARGDLLGQVARGGHCDNSCVHLGVRVDDWYVNPMGFFREKPRLLPWE